MSEPAANGAIHPGQSSTPPSESHGRAALILVESLMHALVAKGSLSREEFIDVIELAADVESEIAALTDPAPSHFSRSLLYPLAAAFRQELGR